MQVFSYTSLKEATYKTTNIFSRPRFNLWLDRLYINAWTFIFLFFFLDMVEESGICPFWNTKYAVIIDLNNRILNKLCFIQEWSSLCVFLQKPLFLQYISRRDGCCNHCMVDNSSNTTAYGERIFVRYISSGEESGGRKSTDFSCTL